MVSMVILVVIILCAGGIVWMRWRRGQAYTTPIAPEAPRETLALQAFTHGNTCLAAGQFTEAIAAFHQTRALEPKHPHVAGRLAEGEPRQDAGSATPLGNPTAGPAAREPSALASWLVALRRLAMSDTG